MVARLFRFLAVVLLFSACGGYNTVRIRSTNFDEEVSRSQNLVFTFNKELMGDTLLLNKWDTLAYMKFEPEIKGKFMWTGKSELTFSPSGLLAPGTDYKAIPRKELLLKANRDWSIHTVPVTFHTPYPALNEVSSYWALSGDPEQKVEMRLQLDFNCPVAPERLKLLLKVVVKDAGQAYRITSVNEGESLEIALPADPGAVDLAAVAEVLISKGLIAAGGNHPTDSDIAMKFGIPAIDRVTITGMTPDFDAGKGTVAILTSQPLAEQDLAGFIQVVPEVKFEAEMLENGLLLRGDFLESKSYDIHILPGLKGIFGRETTEETVMPVSFGTPEPYLAFTEKNAVYLSARGERNLGVQVINIPEIRLTVFRVFENNLQHYMRQGKEWYWDYEDDEYFDYSGYSTSEDYGKPVFSKVIRTRSLPRTGNISLLSIDLDEFRFDDRFKGAYVVRVESTEKRRYQDAVMVSLSDLGLIVRQGNRDAMVFVNSLKDCQPVKGAKVELVSSSNQKILSAVTDNRGVAVFRDIAGQAPGFRISMVTARSGDDFNYLLYDQAQVEMSRFDVGGKFTANLNYDVFIYGDRDLYRPGDTVHFNTIVRTMNRETVKDLPIRIRILAPNGKEYKSLKKQLNVAGSADGDFYLPGQAMTGTYFLEVYSSNNVLLASRKFAVEEFMPDRIKVTAKTSKETYSPGEAIALDILAENLYGTPAAGKKYEVEARYSRKPFQAKSFPDYDFLVSQSREPELRSVMLSGTTDGQGHAISSIETLPYTEIGMVEGKIFTTVFDETGRPVNRVNKVEIHTQDVFYGIRKFDTWVGTRKPLNFQFIAVDKNGKALQGEDAEVSVVYANYETVIERDGTSYRYVSQRKENTVFSRTVKTGASGGQVSFTPARSGSYLVFLKRPGSTSYVKYEFNAYGSGDTDYSSFEVNRDGEVTITADKAQYMPGETAKLLFKAPFDGRMLVCLEQDNALDYRYLELKNKSAELEIPVASAHVPNVYVDATLVKRIENTDIPLTVAHGVISLKVESPSSRLPVSLSVPEKSRSGVNQLITVKTTPGARVTVAVVDEGILQITNYMAPDPHGWFYQKRALEVAGYDVYSMLFPELKRSRSSTAGGESFDLSRRINPLANRRVKLISKWSGVLTANSSGICTFPLAIPQFSGALRVMAVAYKDDKFGSSEKTVKVADPVVVSSALPRFMSPGDVAKMAVSLNNTTGKGGKATVTVSATGPLKVKGKSTDGTTLGAGAGEVVTFDIEASGGIGSGTIRVTVEALGKTFAQTTELPVRPAAGLTFYTGSGMVKAGSEKSFKSSANFLPAGVKSSLLLSKSLASEYLSNLSSLMRYPYGCMEQTVSAAFPQLYLRDLALSATQNLAPPDNAPWMTPEQNIQQAILKVEAYQLYNGGFPMWPSGGNADWWISAYITHFLLEAQKAGYETSDKVIGGALKFLGEKVKTREMATCYFTDEGGKLISKSYPCKEIFYSMFVLALADKAPVPTMNFYKSQAASLAADSRYLLSASCLLAGDRKGSQALLPRAFPGEKTQAMDGDAFASFIRDKAISLLALVEADPNNPQVGELVRVIGTDLKQSRYLSTQENAFAMIALGKFAARTAKSDLTADIKIDGKLAGTYQNKDLTLKNDLSNRQVSIAAKGTGSLYYFYEQSGVPVSPPKGEEDSYLKVRKYFYDRTGKQINDLKFSQNDLVTVDLFVEPPAGKTIRNVAVTDLLPACFEIENTRLQGETAVAAATPDVAAYTDIRDDRISFFTDLSGPRHFRYTVRAVSRGSFRMGPVSADAMYNGMFHSRSGGKTVIVD